MFGIWWQNIWTTKFNIYSRKESRFFKNFIEYFFMHKLKSNKYMKTYFFNYKNYIKKQKSKVHFSFIFTVFDFFFYTCSVFLKKIKIIKYNLAPNVKNKNYVHLYSYVVDYYIIYPSKWIMILLDHWNFFHCEEN